MKIKRVTVKKNERGLLLRNGDFERVLQPGTHWLFAGLDTLRVDLFALEQAAFTHGLADYLMAKEPGRGRGRVRARRTHREPGRPAHRERRAGRGARAGHPAPVLEGPGRTCRSRWSPSTVRVPRPKCRQALVARLVQTQLRQRAVQGLAGVLQVQVPDHGAGMLWVDGKVERLLAAGSYAFWKFNRNVSVELVDLRLQALEVTGQEILTRDKVSLRLNLSATWRFTDVLKAYKELAKPADHLYRELQFGLRAAVGTRSLDELLENKTVIDEVVTAQVKSKLADYGLQLDGVGVKDIVLPGEMKAHARAGGGGREGGARRT